jgi:hypothetical protein
MFLGWLLIFAGLMGGLYCLSLPASLDAALGFSMGSLAGGALLIYLGYTKKKVFKKK